MPRPEAKTLLSPGSNKYIKLATASIWGIAVIAYIHYSASHHLSPLATAQKLLTWIAASFWGPALFIVIYTVRPLFLFSAVLLSLGAGSIFGPLWGAVYTIIGSNLGAALAYGIGRLFGSGLWNGSTTNPSNLTKYIEKMREKSFETVFIMRLLYLPYDLVNYLAGFMKINFFSFILATALGSLPATISFTLLGSSVGINDGHLHFDWRILASSITIFIVSLLISRSIKYFSEANRTGQPA